MDRNIFWGNVRLAHFLCNKTGNTLFTVYTAKKEGVYFHIKEGQLSEKELSFTKKIWQQAKAGYLCAPLLKKAIALKKISNDYA